MTFSIKQLCSPIVLKALQALTTAQPAVRERTSPGDKRKPRGAVEDEMITQNSRPHVPGITSTLES